MSDAPRSAPPSRRVRRVTRVIRDIDMWTVFKVGIVFHAAMYVMLLVSGVLLWSVGSATGTIDNIEQFMESFGWSSFTFDGGAVLRGYVVLGVFGIALATALWVVGALVFNLIAELVGGIRVTVLEEEVVARPVEARPTQG